MIQLHRGLEDRLKSLLDEITYKPDYWLVAKYDNEHHVYYLQVEFLRTDIVTGEPGTGHGGKLWVTGDMTDQQIVQGAFALFKAVEEHECREWFAYKGKRIYGPHISLGALVQVADRTTY